MGLIRNALGSAATNGGISMEGKLGQVASGSEGNPVADFTDMQSRSLYGSGRINTTFFGILPNPAAILLDRGLQHFDPQGSKGILQTLTDAATTVQNREFALDQQISDMAIEIADPKTKPEVAAQLQGKMMKLKSLKDLLLETKDACNQSEISEARKLQQQAEALGQIGR